MAATETGAPSAATETSVPSAMPPSSAATATAKPATLVASILADSSHPTALLFHFAFRTSALLVYLFAPWLLSDSFVLVFVLTVVLLAMDFWTVKNVTGRLLVGERWWTRTAADGSTSWTYECKPPATYRANPTDARLFWGSLYGYTAIWALFGLVALLRLAPAWLTLTLLALAINAANLVGYLKCDSSRGAVQAALGGPASLGGLFRASRLGAIF